ncbi:MAG: hypothetical protein ACRDH6_06195 [Actinomycetota bacterium]
MRKTINVLGNAAVGGFFLYWGIRGFVGLAQGDLKPQLGGVLGTFFVPLGFMALRSGYRLVAGPRLGAAADDLAETGELVLEAVPRLRLALEFAAGPRRSVGLRRLFFTLPFLAIAIAVFVSVRA